MRSTDTVARLGGDEFAIVLEPLAGAADARVVSSATTICGSFVRGLPGDRDDRNIVRSIIALGTNLDLTLIAEGVELRSSARFFRLKTATKRRDIYCADPSPPASYGSDADADSLFRRCLRCEAQEIGRMLRDVCSP